MVLDFRGSLNGRHSICKVRDRYATVTTRGMLPAFSRNGGWNDPVIDNAKCVYPRCTACIDNCVANAIDLSVMGSAAAVSNSPVLVKGCLHCSPANCIRSCAYDAITYEQTQQVHVIDMKKCTYPKCTLCVDHCPMHTIDFTHNPPMFHKNCEGCDVCYMLCPTQALDITNFAVKGGVKGNHCGGVKGSQ